MKKYTLEMNYPYLLSVNRAQKLLKDSTKGINAKVISNIRQNRLPAGKHQERTAMGVMEVVGIT
jgi:hypothetical protein